jgi:hypothetical protein
VIELRSCEQRARDKSLLVKRLYPSMKKGENCGTNYDPTETKSCLKCPSRGHHEFDCFKYRRYSPTICSVCKKFNHYEDACNEWEKLPSSRQPRDNSSQRDTYTQLEWKADIRNVEIQIQGLAAAVEKSLGARPARDFSRSRDAERSPSRDKKPPDNYRRRQVIKDQCSSKERKDTETRSSGMLSSYEQRSRSRDNSRRPYRDSRDVSRSPDRDSQRQQRSDNRQSRENCYNDQKSRISRRPYRDSRDVSRSPDRDSQRQQRSGNRQSREDCYNDQESRDSCLSVRRSYPRND